MIEKNQTGEFESSNPLCRFLATKAQLQKATVVRVLLESYKPFVTFRERLSATGNVVDAGRQTKAAHSLPERHGDISATLLSLGTFSQAIRTGGGGHYEVATGSEENSLERLMLGCAEMAASEELIRKLVGIDAIGWISRDHVVIPLSDAMRRADAQDGQGAITQAGNAIESFLIALASQFPTQLNGTGINAKLEELKRADVSKMPSKLMFAGKYLGHIRNAADHGVDADIGAPWSIRPATGREYVFVACSFIAACTALILGKTPEM